jgi:hypothetical protein
MKVWPNKTRTLLGVKLASYAKLHVQTIALNNMQCKLYIKGLHEVGLGLGNMILYS